MRWRECFENTTRRRAPAAAICSWHGITRAASMRQQLRWLRRQGRWWRAGQEPEKVRAFKQALGLSDVDAAPVHLDVGRRLVRSSYEAGSREANALEKKVRGPPVRRCGTESSTMTGARPRALPRSGWAAENAGPSHYMRPRQVPDGDAVRHKGSALRTPARIVGLWARRRSRSSSSSATWCLATSKRRSCCRGSAPSS